MLPCAKRGGASRLTASTSSRILPHPAHHPLSLQASELKKYLDIQVAKAENGDDVQEDEV
eukprot:3453415-Rhodomonas_salina.1